MIYIITCFALHSFLSLENFVAVRTNSKALATLVNGYILLFTNCVFNLLRSLCFSILIMYRNVNIFVNSAK